MSISKQEPKLKICGNHQPSDLLLIKQYIDYIDYIGFIFTPMSKRYVSPQTVKLWLNTYPSLRSKAVAVFLNQELEEVKEILLQTGIDHVQLHGRESVDYCTELKEDKALNKQNQLQIWKVIPVEEGKIAPFKEYLPIVDTILLDTKIKHVVGGTGQPFAWSVIPKVQQAVAEYGLPLLVAGGINPNNVAELLVAYEIDGIDVASGVEVDLVKDEQKLIKLIKGVKRNERNKVQLP